MDGSSEKQLLEVNHMAIYLNPGSDKFLEAKNSEIYVDKTSMISYINTVVCTEQKYISVSRPRRFGKTIAANMLASYYGMGDSRQVFLDRKIAQYENWDRYLNRFDVIKIVMTDFIKKNRDVEASLDRLQKLIVRDIKMKYSDVDYFDTDDLVQSMLDVYAQKQTQFVIIINEWDAIFRICREDKEGQTFYLDFLRDWLKDKGYVALAYITGILPIKKYGQHSALNMFREFSVITPMQLAEYAGFTESEVQALCNGYGRDYQKIKEWYDGYDLVDVVPPDPNYELMLASGKELQPNHYSIYSPLSVMEAVSTGIIRNYWNTTETYEALAEYIRMNYDGLKDAVALMMDGGSVKIDIRSYQNDMTTFHGRDDVLTLLIHLGYLRYNPETAEVSIPNREILDEFRTSTRSEEWINTFKSFKKSQELLQMTWNCDAERVAELLEWFHDMAENKTYNSEAALSYAVQMAYYAGQRYYTTIQELDSGKGYCDLVYLPSPKNADKPALLIELKYNKSIRTAADQVRSKNYLQKLEHYRGNILVVSINYNRDADSGKGDFKHHTCEIIRR